MENEDVLDLESLKKAELIGIVRQLALDMSDEVNATPQELIEDAYQVYKKTETKYHLEVSRGNSGMAGDYETMDHALLHLREYQSDFPGELVAVSITKVN